MKDETDFIRNQLERLADLAHVALITPTKNSDRLERTLQLVCQSIEALAWARQHSGYAEHQREADEAVALCQRIVEQAQAVGLSIMTELIPKQLPPHKAASAACLKPSSAMPAGQTMAVDPAPHSDQVERFRHLMRRVTAETARSRCLTETAHEACARAASLCAESAMLLDEMRFRQTDHL
jgi:hypothetical protein